MPIPNLTDELPINQYTASNGQTEFAFTFYIFALSDIKVYVNDILKTITTDYVVRKNDGTVIGDADLPMDGGKIIFNVGRTAGEKISLNRDIPVDRSTQFSTGGAFKADSLNSELTRILTIAQQLKRDVARSFRLAPSDAEGGSLQLPTNRANNILAFDANANLILTKFADIDKANVSPFIATLLDDISASIARGTLNAQELNANLTALAGLAGVANLTTLAGLTGASNKLPYFTGAGAMAVRDLLATTTTQGIAFLSNPITISNNALDANNDIDFSAGNFQFSDGSGQAVATAIMTKRLDATWSAGTNQGGLLNGTAVPKAINSTYHCYKIYNPTTGVEDSAFLLGVSGTAPDPTSVLPSGFTKFERRGSIITDPSGNIRAFTLTANRFEYNSNITDFNATLAASETSITVSAPCGLRTRVCLALGTNATGTGAAVAKVYSHNISTPTITLFNATAYAGVAIVAGAGYAEATTNLSSQIKINAAVISGSPTLTGQINTSAIIDLTLRF